MSMQIYYPVVSIWFYLLIIAALEALALYTWRFREFPGAKIAVYGQTAKCILLSALVLASVETELSEKLYWITLKKAAIITLPYLWFLFTLEISQQQKLIPSVLKRGISIGFACLLMLTLFNWHGFTWQDAWLDGQAVWLVTGLGLVVGTVYAYGLGILTTVLVVRWIVISAGLRRRQALWYSVAVLISWASHSIWKISGWSIQAMPWGFLLNGMIVSWIYYRWQLYNILPLAQDVAARNVIVGLLIIDEQDYIVDMNPAAKSMLEDLPVFVGGEFKMAAAAWPDLAKADSLRDGEVVEARRKRAEGDFYYELKRIALQVPKDHSLGRIVLLTDITKQKRDQAQMVEQQRAVAIMEERASLARELHDNLCQVLSYINLQAHSIRGLASSGQTAETVSGVSRLIDVAQQASDDVREYIRDVQREKMSQKGFVKALREYIAQVKQVHGLDVDLEVPQDIDQTMLSGLATQELLRIVQEAVNNIRKHAEASYILLKMESDAAVVRIVVTDDGKGFDPAACGRRTGFGLTTMRERAEKLGGTLEIASVLGQGTKVAATIPRKGLCAN